MSPPLSPDLMKASAVELTGWEMGYRHPRRGLWRAEEMLRRFHPLMLGEEELERALLSIMNDEDWRRYFGALAFEARPRLVFGAATIKAADVHQATEFGHSRIVPKPDSLRFAALIDQHRFVSRTVRARFDSAPWPPGFGQVEGWIV